MGLSSFIQPLLPSKIKKSREISIKFDLITVQGHPGSSILVSIKSSYVTSYKSLIVTLALSATVFEILTLKARKWINFPTPARGNPLECRDKIWHLKTRVLGLPDGEEIMTLAFFVLTQYRLLTDGRTNTLLSQRPARVKTDKK